jgi:hypothetical protein
MMFRGFFMAVDDATVRALRRQKGDPARRQYVKEIEETAEQSQGTDKAWYVLFNCFANS